MSENAWQVVVNLRRAYPAIRRGAKAYVQLIPGDGESIRLHVRMRSGRWTDHWVRIADIENPRVQWVASEMREITWAHRKREQAEDILARLKELLAE